MREGALLLGRLQLAMTETERLARVEVRTDEHETRITRYEERFLAYAEVTAQALSELKDRFGNGNGFSSKCDEHTARIRSTAGRVDKIESLALAHNRWLLGILSVVIAGILLQVAKTLFHF